MADGSTENLKVGAGCLLLLLWIVLAIIAGIVTAQVTGEIGYGVAAFFVMVAIMLSRWVLNIKSELNKGSS